MKDTMGKIKKVLLGIFRLIVSDGSKRKLIKQKIETFNKFLNIFDQLQIIRFIIMSIPEKSVLIIEPNKCHSEILPGYAKYFLDLDYHVHIVLCTQLKKEKPFVRMNMKKTRIFSCSHGSMNVLINLNKLTRYQNILLTTTAYYELRDKNNYHVSTLSKYKKLGKYPSLIVVEHDLKDISRFNEDDLLKSNKLVTLGKFKKGIFINPHYFGKVSITPKNHKIRFICVGAIIPSRRNYSKLMDAVERLAANKQNFEVVIIGLGKIEDIPSHIRPYFILRGRLKFSEMYHEMESADFYLPLLDQDNSEHERYITSAVTGAAQLIYGFSKPCVIHKKFAGFYRIDTSISIVYEKDLYDALCAAISLNQEQYSEMQKGLVKIACDIYSESLDNLKKIVI